MVRYLMIYLLQITAECDSKRILKIG